MDRINNTRELFQEFEKMKEAHNRQMNSICLKYTELQTLFEERPSREEDLNKIKELLNVKDIMNDEVKKCQKKVK